VDFVTLTRHLLANDGRWAAMKGAPAQELMRLPSDVAVLANIPLRVPNLDAARSLVILKAE
jgi:16S rRNA (guanine527-N7)-methyltransferase